MPGFVDAPLPRWPGFARPFCDMKEPPRPKDRAGMARTEAADVALRISVRAQRLRAAGPVPQRPRRRRRRRRLRRHPARLGLPQAPTQPPPRHPPRREGRPDVGAAAPDAATLRLRPPP